MKIIPAIDIIEGQAVRLYQGDYEQKKVYSNDPVATAKAFENLGLKYLHVVDLDGAKHGRVINLETVKAICKETNIQVDFGGGVKTAEDLEEVLAAGVAQVTIGTLAIKNPELVKSWIKKYGAEKIILGADVSDRKIAISGWAEKSEVDIFDFLESYISEGIEYVICTDISKDGVLQGSSEDLYKELLSRFPQLKLIASGGVSSIEELDRLKAIGCYGAIIGKAFYEGKILPGEVAEWEDKSI